MFISKEIYKQFKFLVYQLNTGLFRLPHCLKFNFKTLEERSRISKKKNLVWTFSLLNKGLGLSHGRLKYNCKTLDGREFLKTKLSFKATSFYSQNQSRFCIFQTWFEKYSPSWQSLFFTTTPLKYKTFLSTWLTSFKLDAEFCLSYNISHFQFARHDFKSYILGQTWLIWLYYFIIIKKHEPWQNCTWVVIPTLKTTRSIKSCFCLDYVQPDPERVMAGTLLNQERVWSQVQLCFSF